MKVIKCDICSKEIRNPLIDSVKVKVKTYADTFYRKLDICDNCKYAINRFIKEYEQNTKTKFVISGIIDGKKKYLRGIDGFVDDIKRATIYQNYEYALEQLDDKELINNTLRTSIHNLQIEEYKQ